MKKRFALLLTAFLCATALYAGFAEKWNEAYASQEQVVMTEGAFEVHMPKKYVAPGPDPKTFGGPSVNLKELTPEKYERLKEDVVRTEKELKEATKKVEKLKEEYDEESLEYAEKRLKAAEVAHNKAKMNVKAAEDFIKIQKAKAMGKKVKSAGADKPLTHVAFTQDYFFLQDVMKQAVNSVGSMDAMNNVRTAWTDGSAKVYVVTDEALYKKMKGKDPVITPVTNVSQEPETRSFLLFCSPELTNQLAQSFSYAACETFFHDFLAVENPEGEAADVVRVGYCACCSKLNAVVTPQKIYDPPVLEEEKLFLPSQLTDPGPITDPKQCVYFLRQAKVMVKPMIEAGAEMLGNYFTKVKYGNSGMRASFNNIRLHKDWGAGYDGFMLTLPEKGFLPLTKEKEPAKK
ncbi:hypothetical protein J6U76_01725 [bacterium]|nr:hypothetical protein [bacterium]